MDILTLPVGSYQANCYFLQQDDHLALIDVGGDASKVIEKVKESGATLDYILLTHGHFDHTTDVPKVKNAFPDAQVFIKQEDAQGAGNTIFPLMNEVDPLYFLEDGQVLPLGSVEIKVLTTPGHSPGSVSFQVGPNLFTGDTLFAGSMGRVDFPGGNYETIMKSLKKLADLPGDYHVYPGHDRKSTLENERTHNPYVLEALGKG